MPTQPLPITANILTIELLEEKVLQSLRLWHSHEQAGSPLGALQIFEHLCLNADYSLRQTTNELLRQGLDMLKVSHPDEQAILSLRFADEQPVQVVANRMNLVEGSVLRKQQQGIHHLAEFLFQRERQERATQRNRMNTRVPPIAPFQLWGIEEAVQELTTILLPGEAPWLVVIEGMGGIGKTVLADVLCHRLIDLDVWEDFAWVSLQPKSFSLGGTEKSLTSSQSISATVVDLLLAQLQPAALHPANQPSNQSENQSLEVRSKLLCARLKERPQLIVLDGVDSYAMMEELLLLARRLVNPSKVLITGRLRMFHEADAYHFTMGELTVADALRLLRTEAKLRNLHDVATASDLDLYPIYSVVGGNPLALRLVIGQLHIYPLDQVLADLTYASGDHVSSLYKYIYTQIWEQLEEPTRYAALPLLLITEAGDTFNELVSLFADQIDPTETRRVLEQFVTFGLINVRGSFVERRYWLHQLTRTFLRQQMIQWALGQDRRSSDYSSLFELLISNALAKIYKIVAEQNLSLSNHRQEKIKYLIEYALQFESLWTPALNLLLVITNALESDLLQPHWLPILKKMVRECQRLGDENSESKLLTALYPLLEKYSDGAPVALQPLHQLGLFSNQERLQSSPYTSPFIYAR